MVLFMSLKLRLNPTQICSIHLLRVLLNYIEKGVRGVCLLAPSKNAAGTENRKEE